MPETVDKAKTWKWTEKGDLKVETEALIFAAQEQALRTNYVKFNLKQLLVCLGSLHILYVFDQHCRIISGVGTQQLC